MRNADSNQTGLMPALATTSRHFGTSSSMRFRMPSGPLARTFEAIIAQLFRNLRRFQNFD
jgi:hypothetical protein